MPAVPGGQAGARGLEAGVMGPDGGVLGALHGFFPVFNAEPQRHVLGLLSKNSSRISIHSLTITGDARLALGF